MLSQRIIVSTLTVFSILIFMVSDGQAVQMPSSTIQFQRVEQPLSLKTIVTLSGLGLIALELWWFLYSKPKTQQTQSSKKRKY